MATYKVIQDIEADDKLLGPLTLRQFVYAGATLFLVYMSYLLAARGAAFLLVLTVPPIFLTGFFAFPWGREQPTEIWALARVRFLLKPRRRIWDQTGMKEIVTITAPKRVEKVYTDGLSQNEVKSRLQALATTIDSRGWAIKNADINPYNTTSVLATGIDNSERLLDPTMMPQAVPADDTTIYDDLLDPTHNPKAQQFDTMLEQSAQAQRQRLIDQMQQPAQTTSPAISENAVENNVAAVQARQVVPANTSVQTVANTLPPLSPSNTDDEQALLAELRNHEQDQSLQYSHLPTILPLSEQAKQAKSNPQPQPNPLFPAASPTSPASSQTVTPEPDAAILELATKDDWNISTIARQAKKAHGEEPDEVVISLH